jgi:hypothetical protein
MTRPLFTFLLGLLFVCPALHAQVSQGGKPYSYTSDLKTEIAVKTLAALPVENLKKSDEQNEKQGLPMRIGVIVPVSYSLTNAGTWTELANGDRIWRLKVQAEGALATSLYYENFYLPEGATLFVYNEDRTQLIGSYTSENNQEKGLFATEILKGKASIVEYYEPGAVKGKGHLTISGVNHIYNEKLPEARKEVQEKAFGDAGSCNVNVNCPEGANWQNQKRAVARIIFRVGSGAYLCTGTLVNNVKGECKSYFLTASHCGSDASLSDFSQWIFYFNYEAPSCANPANEPVSNTITGCVQRARSGDNGGVEGADFQLLQFTQPIPASYNVYYAGWDATNVASTSGVGIHHPRGDIKKISTYTATLTDDTYGTTAPPYTHWRVFWVQTQTNWGITEGGSSGSPLFNSAGQIVGQLSGGASACNVANSNKWDLYGKVAYGWTSNGTDALHQLKPWLDPDNTGVLSLDGTNTLCSDTTPELGCPDPYEPNNSLAAAYSIDLDSVISAKIGTPSDTDYYKFQALNGGLLIAQLDNLPADYNLRLLNDSGTVIAASSNTGLTADTIYTNITPGLYYLQVIGYGGSFNDTLCYRLAANLTVVAECEDLYEPNNTPATGAPVPLDTIVRGLISSTTDRDYFTFSTTVFSNITINLTTLPYDYDIRLYRSTGALIARSENGGNLSETISVRGVTPGSFYIEIVGYAGAYSITNCYSLRVHHEPTTSSKLAVTAPVSKIPAPVSADIKVYPVPTTGTVYAEFNETGKTRRYITVTDINGKIVFTKTYNTVSGYNRLEVLLPSSLKNGIYILSDGQHAKKVVLQR